MAADNRYPIATHPSITGSAWNSVPTVGRATFMDDPKNGVMNAAMHVMRSMSRLSVACAVFMEYG